MVASSSTSTPGTISTTALHHYAGRNYDGTVRLSNLAIVLACSLFTACGGPSAEGPALASGDVSCERFMTAKSPERLSIARGMRIGVVDTSRNQALRASFERYCSENPASTLKAGMETLGIDKEDTSAPPIAQVQPELIPAVQKIKLLMEVAESVTLDPVPAKEACSPETMYAWRLGPTTVACSAPAGRVNEWQGRVDWLRVKFATPVDQATALDTVYSLLPPDTEIQGEDIGKNATPSMRPNGTCLVGSYFNQGLRDEILRYRPERMSDIAKGTVKAFLASEPTDHSPTMEYDPKHVVEFTLAAWGAEGISQCVWVSD